MSVLTDFGEMMPVSVTVKRLTGTDSFGNNTYDAGTAHSVRLEPVTTTLAVSTTQAGAVLADIGKSTMVIMDITSPPYAAGDLVSAPVGDLRVVEASVEYDEAGPYYQALTCRNNQET